MASLFRPKWTRRNPATGKIEKGRLKKWYAKYRDENGLEKRVPLSEDKTVAQAMLGDLIRKVELARGGIPTDPYAEHRRTTITEHIRDWRTALEAKGATQRQVDLNVGRLNAVVNALGWKMTADISPSRFEALLADWRRSRKRFGAQTSNHYVRCVKSFCRWLWRDRRASEHLLAHVSTQNVALDRRHDRRELPDAELVRLFAAALRGPARLGLTGAQREMLYLAAVYTGLRAAELASLTAASFDLRSKPPTVTVEAAYSKHRREDVLPLHDDLAARLRVYLAALPPGGRLWPGTWADDRRAAEFLQFDLKAAGIPYQDSAGRFADFHALRHTFATRLVRAGVSPKEAQTLARHSTITLTLNIYVRLGLHDTAAAVNKLPPIGGKKGSYRRA